MWSWVSDQFPRSEVQFPGERYACLRHPVLWDVDSEMDHLEGDGLLLDLETLGFVGRPLFLVGLLKRDTEGGWEVRQLLARDYGEEEEVVRAFAEEAARCGRWVSFNGKSFDLPSLRERAAYYGIRLPVPREHLDLLHPARKLYRGVLPNCRLRTLEMQVFGRSRVHDLPGAEIPGVYHAFVRTGQPDGLARILRHNREDLVTLARLWAHLSIPDPDVSATDSSVPDADIFTPDSSVSPIGIIRSMPDAEVLLPTPTDTEVLDARGSL